MSETIGRRTKHQRRKAARPTEILDAALQEFSQKGFAGTKLEDVAKLARVSKGTVYHYYKDKQSLFEALVMDRLIAPLQSEPPTDMASDINASDLLKLALGMAYEQGKTSGSLALVRVILLEPDSIAGFSTNPIMIVVQTTSVLLSHIVDKGIEAGEFSKTARDLHTLDFLLPVLSSMILYSPLNEIADFRMDEYVENQIERLIHELSV